MEKNLLAKIEEGMSGFSKGQKLIGTYILNHFDKAAFMTASKLGATVGVSESTVVRFASEIGFDGYPQLQKALHEMIRSKLTAAQRFELTNEQIGTSDVLQKVLNLDIEKIRKTLDEISHKDFEETVQAIVQAKNIYIIGVRSAASLASFLSFYFNHIFENVRLINTTSVSEMFEQILRIGEDDVLIGISFPRYSSRTVKAINYAKSRNAQVVAITDSHQSPVAKNADHTLIARSDMASFVDSLVAPLSLINALIVAIGMRKSEEISYNFEMLEQIWDEYDVYEKAGENDAHDEKM